MDNVVVWYHFNETSDSFQSFTIPASKLYSWIHNILQEYKYGWILMDIWYCINLSNVNTLSFHLNIEIVFQHDYFLITLFFDLKSKHVIQMLLQFQTSNKVYTFIL